MGMSIDEAEALEILKDIRLNTNYIQNRESRTGMACKLAIDIMRKYKMIEDIIEWKNYDNLSTEDYYGDYLRICDIRKVLDNGNDD